MKVGEEYVINQPKPIITGVAIPDKLYIKSEPYVSWNQEIVRVDAHYYQSVEDLMGMPRVSMEVDLLVAASTIRQYYTLSVKTCPDCNTIIGPDGHCESDRYVFDMLKLEKD